MNGKVTISEKVEAQVVRNLTVKSCINLTAHWEWEHFRAGKLIDQWEYDNVCTAEGLNAMLDIMFHAATQITTWYVEIFETDTTPADGTTYAVPVYTPSTAYDEATRPEYVEAAASTKSITNSANKAVFTISATKIIYGAALVGGGTAPTTKGDVAGGGTLFSGSKFAASKSVVDNDVLNVTITITLADS
uniref:Uncharacterized protein n=1 Tax=Candidatus Desulfatibia profunda TaxID=2841695 RepID=A0A8J6NK01_9BACT|nr:hypothetical protein [Candidatus Desulfatibia profunda]